MKIFWQYIKQQAWFIALSLLVLTAYGATAPAAQMPSFSATAGGTTDNLTLTSSLDISDAEVGINGNIYLGFNFNQTWYFNNGFEWVRFDGGAMPVYAAAPLANRTMEVVRDQDMSSLIGGQLYAGYGLTESDMLANGKYGLVYTLTTDTTAPTVTGTIHAYGATNVPINTKIGATFSEAMDPLTITGANYTIKETVSGATVTGTVSYAGVSAAFMPSSSLSGNTDYTVTIKGGVGGVKDLAGNPLASDFVISWTTAAVADTLAPTVTSTIHANGATNVNINTKIGATFSEGMDPLTITGANFTVRETMTGVAIAGAVSYSGVSATFTPSGNLTGNTGYTITIKGGSDGVKDLAGNPLTNDFNISWTTWALADTTAPTVTGTLHAYGATNVAINTKVGTTFSEGMDPLTITNLNFTLKETVSGAAVAGIVSYSGVTAVFIPSSKLAGNRGYTVTVKGGAKGVKDLAGNPMASDFVISWTTTGDTDFTAPTVSGAFTGAKFSEEMDPLTITNVNFTLRETVAGTPVAGTVSYSGVTAIFIPTRNLVSGASYTATIKGGVDGATDMAGNALATDHVWSWTTNTVEDTIAPTVTSTINANGATNVPINTQVGATFSEGMDPLTITNVNFTLRGTASGATVAGIVSYSGVNAVFVPSGNLAPGTSYTATIRGGINGAKDMSGNVLAIDYVWVWTTGATPIGST